MVLKPSDHAAPVPAVALFSVISKSPLPEFDNTPVPVPKLWNQSEIPVGQVYWTAGVCAWARDRNKTPTESASRTRRAIMIFSSPPTSGHANRPNDQPIVVV